MGDNITLEISLIIIFTLVSSGLALAVVELLNCKILSVKEIEHGTK